MSLVSENGAAAWLCGSPVSDCQETECLCKKVENVGIFEKR